MSVPDHSRSPSRLSRSSDQTCTPTGSIASSYRVQPSGGGGGGRREVPSGPPSTSDRRTGTADDRRPARSPAACARAPGSPASPARGTPGAADPRSPSAAAPAARSTPRRATQPSRHSPPHHRAVRRSAATRAPPSSARDCRVRRPPRPSRPTGSSRTARPGFPFGPSDREATERGRGHVVRMPLELVRQYDDPLAIDRFTGQPVRRRETADDRGRRRPEPAAVRNPVLAPQREAGHRSTQRLEPGAGSTGPPDATRPAAPRPRRTRPPRP